MIITFAGSRIGISHAQLDTIKNLLDQLKVSSDDIALHGCCTGADTDIHHICQKKDMTIVGYPAFADQYQLAEECDKRMPQMSPLKRNHAMVNRCTLVIAAPGTQKEQLRSGTWATIRYCKKLKKPLHVVYPDGKTETFNID